MEFSFSCSCCGQVHDGIPTFGAIAPLSYYGIPEAERSDRCSIGSDDCVIDDEHFFVRGCIEIPVHGHEDPFVWGVWVSLSNKSFIEWAALYHEPQRAHLGPYFGWLDTSIKPYPNTINLKTMVHPRDNGLRPYIAVEPTEHPLAVDQQRGISPERVGQLYEIMVHDSAAD